MLAFIGFTLGYLVGGAFERANRPRVDGVTAMAGPCSCGPVEVKHDVTYHGGSFFPEDGPDLPGDDLIRMMLTRKRDSL